MSTRVLLLFGVLLWASRAFAAAPPAGPDLEQAPSGAFAQVLTPRDFAFPRDHGPHPEFRHEWWYVTGNLEGAGGERFGFELTFFRVALAPLHAAAVAAAPPPDAASHWRTRQVYMAHFAITDVAHKDFWATERYAREALGLAGARPSPFHVWLENWQIVETPDGDWRLQASEGKRSLTLSLHAETPPIPNGNHGMSRKAEALGAASYYYSIPRLSARGTLTDADGRVVRVSGLAWLDREWGSGSLGVDAQGWDWFALQLADHSTLMFYQLRNRDGSRDPNSAGTWVDATGTAHPLRNEDVLIEPQSYWTSPRGGRYPASWKLTVRSLNLTLEITPVLPNQELPTNPRYWEGAVDVRSATLTGRGYVELVGYANAGKD